MAEGDGSPETYGRWAVLEKTSTKRWLCRCDCGVEKSVYKYNLLNGQSQSCGCRQRDVVAEANYRHGQSKTADYGRWQGMVNRATGVVSGKGYDECDIDPAWVGEGGYERFLSDMGPRPPGHEIDRKDPALGYSKENCRWADNKQSARNRRGNRVASSVYKGVSKIKNRWVAVCRGRYLGVFKVEEDAAKAYDASALAEFGDFACLNFPGDTGRPSAVWSQQGVDEHGR